MVAVTSQQTGLRSLPAARERCLFVLLCAVTAALFAVLITAPGLLPTSALTLLVVPAALVLGRGRFLAYSTLVVAGVLTTGLSRVAADEAVGSLAVTLATIPLLGFLLRGRFALGMAGSRPEHLLIELHDRLARSMRLPDLPCGWGAQACTEPAAGQAFGGDVVVSVRTGDLLEVTMVDVSGNGLDAAARATQLTGAVGALLGSVPPEEFLERANEYVIRQGWVDGFATVVHLALDLTTGEYTLARAGHPAPMVREGGTGRWSLLEGSSQVPLGVVPDVRFPRRAGVLAPGDGMVLYSDGVVESRTSAGVSAITRLQRVAARGVAQHGFDTLAARLASSAPSEAEDRTVVVVWRNPATR